MRLLRGGLLNMVMALHRCKHDMLSRRGSSKKWRTSALLIAGSLADGILSVFVLEGMGNILIKVFGEFDTQFLFV